MKALPNALLFPTELHERGASVIAVSDISGGVLDPDGLDVPALHAYVRDHGSLEGYDASAADIEKLRQQREIEHGPQHLARVERPGQHDRKRQCREEAQDHGQ